ncbi:hypothetical protein N9Y42_06425 [Mariniblastus sp.]|nr:hypothetical protein [Mariniblastus sp.]
MTKKTDFASTPKYVLKSEGQPLCSTLDLTDPKSSRTCVYGFSDKSIYDQFIKNAKQPLTPYPLVHGYLTNQIAEVESAGKNGAGIGLIILDATDPKQPTVSAATVKAVLAAQQEKATQVQVELQLVFNSETGGYLKSNSEQTPVAPT